MREAIVVLGISTSDDLRIEKLRQSFRNGGLLLLGKYGRYDVCIKAASKHTGRTQYGQFSVRQGGEPFGDDQAHTLVVSCRDRGSRWISISPAAGG